MVKHENSLSGDTVKKPVTAVNRELRKVKNRIHEVKDKKSLMNVPYRKMISTAMLKSISQNVLYMLEKKKIYLDPGFTAKQMATELHTNTRYLSAVVLLADKRLRNKTIEEIGLMVGFANRQSFYAAFSKYVGETPRSFRMKFI